MDQKQQPQVDVKTIFADALAMVAKANVIATDAFNNLYAEAVKLQKDNEQLKEALASQQKVKTK
jgi:hypothetical protein